MQIRWRSGFWTPTWVVRGTGYGQGVMYEWVAWGPLEFRWRCRW